MSIQRDLESRQPTGGAGPAEVPRQRIGPPPRTGSLPRWQRRYVLAAVGCDLAIVVLVGAAGVLLHVGAGRDAAAHASGFSGIVAGLLIIAGLTLARVWDERILGTGTEELRRMSHAFLGSAVVLGLGGLALEIHSVREWVFGVVPVCALGCLLARYALRRLLHRQRREMRCMLPVLAIGSHEIVTDLIRRTRRDPHFGWRITGVCTPTGTGPGGGATLDGVPVVGDLDAVAGLARHGGYRIVAVAPAPGWGPARLHRLAWALEGTGTELAVEPGVMEVAGPRLHITPVDGLPLLRLSKPRFTGAVRLLKDAFDRSVAAVLLVVLAVPFAVLAAVLRTDGGPAFVVQERLGINGRIFRMVKFRSTIVGTDEGGTAFTRVGAVLRRHALDELPQLLNVLSGSMSLVGPRPPLVREMRSPDPDARRRLLVKPGMTGLSQVSGRSDLSPPELARLDLRYVENWSAALDATILWKSAGAMLLGRGVL